MPSVARHALSSLPSPINPHPASLPHKPTHGSTNSQDCQARCQALEMQLLTAVRGLERCPLVSREELELGVRRTRFNCHLGKSWVNRYLSLGCHHTFCRLGASTKGICAWPWRLGIRDQVPAGLASSETSLPGLQRAALFCLCAQPSLCAHTWCPSVIPHLPSDEDNSQVGLGITVKDSF